MSFDQTFPTAPRQSLLVKREIAHLEWIVARWSGEGGGSLLGQAYWRKRVDDLARNPESPATQHATMRRMLECVNTAI